MLSQTISNLIRELSKLPSIGEKTAMRMAYHLIALPRSEVQALAQSIIDARQKVALCSICFNITDEDPCAICQGDRGKADTICVVETPAHLAALERTGTFNGMYHVLHGTISPLRNVTPANLKIKELMQRLHSNSIREVILATNPTREGETTAIYLAKLLQPLGITVTRLAQGIPRGGEIEYLDESTLKSSLEGRHVIRLD
ncbi:MAG: recombination protein RecR [Deltaproteobacteria bacterium]|nr:recombination protein RecR [Deltaproteobacteria bacterium]